MRTLTFVWSSGWIRILADSATVRNSLIESGGLRQSLPLSIRKSAASRLRQTVPDLICPPKKIRRSPAEFYKFAGLLKNPPESTYIRHKNPPNLRRTVVDHGGIFSKRTFFKAEFDWIKRIFTLYWYLHHGPLHSTKVRHSPLQICWIFVANCSWLWRVRQTCKSVPCSARNSWTVADFGGLQRTF